MLRNLSSSIPALLIGAVGGAVFLYLRMPLAWMLGAMFFTGVTVLAGLDRKVTLRVEPRLRTVMIVIIGVMLGSAFKPEMIDRAREWLGLIILMLAYIPIVTTICYWMFRRMARLDPVTAYFSAAPGGLQEMTLVGEAFGGDGRSIILTHALRIFITVMTVPVYFRFIEGLNVPPMAQGPHFWQLPWHEGALLILCGGAGWYAAKFLRIPAAQLVGPMIVSALVHLFGWSHAAPPPELVAIAQVVMGAALGCRFVGTPLKEVGRIATWAALATLVMLGVALGMTLGFADWAGIKTEAMMLVLAPGGMAEMSLVALGLGVEVAIVASMHIFRIAVVVIAVPPVFRLLGLKQKS
ncbi:AbrB family transcriptional regulator [Ferrovibrio terrae]|uniref:AbrB family transcriptional regulator n=1 Tax=Ferrovibrio terrae TaxID=2594003 RepID=A0A516H378_9PROT|nr:AbrB family transcriptional regulator [Ferrovibrio terrae]QDO98221.1 AbrB family transcriptional regulator [Ferrovibrio terrae]